MVPFFQAGRQTGKLTGFQRLHFFGRDCIILVDWQSLGNTLTPPDRRKRQHSFERAYSELSNRWPEIRKRASFMNFWISRHARRPPEFPVTGIPATALSGPRSSEYLQSLEHVFYSHIGDGIRIYFYKWLTCEIKVYQRFIVWNYSLWLLWQGFYFFAGAFW